MDAHDLRIGDAERERTMESLREHFAQGRLTHEELDERLDRTLAARTARDLTEITADLPSDGYGYAPPPAPVKDGPVWDDRHAYKEMMRAHRHQLRAAHRQMHEAHREWQKNRHHHPERRRHHHGPGPIVPFLIVISIIAMIAGGFGALKFVLFFAIGAMIFSSIRRAAIRRSLR